MDGTSERQRSQLLGTGSVSSTTGASSTTELLPVPLPGPPNPPAALARGHADRARLADEGPGELADFSEVGCCAARYFANPTTERNVQHKIFTDGLCIHLMVLLTTITAGIAKAVVGRDAGKTNAIAAVLLVLLALVVRVGVHLISRSSSDIAEIGRGLYTAVWLVVTPSVLWLLSEPALQNPLLRQRWQRNQQWHSSDLEGSSESSKRSSMAVMFLLGGLLLLLHGMAHAFSVRGQRLRLCSAIIVLLVILVRGLIRSQNEGITVLKLLAYATGLLLGMQQTTIMRKMFAQDHIQRFYVTRRNTQLEAEKERLSWDVVLRQHNQYRSPVPSVRWTSPGPHQVSSEVTSSEASRESQVSSHYTAKVGGDVAEHTA